MVEAVEQLTRALGHIATLPSTPALRREQIKLQAALIYPLQHVKGQAAPQTKAAAERARLLIEQAEALGEPPEDPLLLLSALDALFQMELVAFDGDVVRERAAQLIALNGAYGAHVKDRLENQLHKLVCNGTLTLQAAQRAIATDWIAAYQKYVGKGHKKRGG